MFKPITFLKCVCIFTYFVIGCASITSIFVYWRNQHWKLEEFDVGGKKITLATKNELFKRELLNLDDDTITAKYGIVRNCKIPEKDDCTWPEGTGFVADEMIVVMQSFVCSIYFFNFFVMLVSIFPYNTLPSKSLYFISLGCFLATVYMLASVTVASIYLNITYKPYNDEVYPSDIVSLYRLDGDDVIIGPSPYKISFAVGFYITVISAICSLFVTFFTGFVAYKTVNGDDDNKAEDGGGGGGNEVKAVKKVNGDIVKTSPAASTAADVEPPSSD